MLALCCSPSLRHLHKGCIDTVFSTTGILANTVALWRPCGSILISCAPHSAPPFVELLAKVTPGFTNQPDCPIHCCCRLKRVRAHSHTHAHKAVKLFIYIRIGPASKPRSCKHNKAAQIGATGNPELPCYLIYREQTCTRNTAGSCVRVSRLCVCVCVSWHEEEGG